MARRHPLTDYITDLAARMGLGSWHITIEDGEVAPSRYAENLLWGERLRGDITLNRNWIPSSRADLREVLVHELLHCHFAPLDQQINSLETVLGALAFGPMIRQFDQDEEKAVQQIAHWWAPSLPLPPAA